MGPISHIYVSTKVTGRETDLLVFGSVLPDIATISSGKIPREKVHDNPDDLLKFIKQKYPDLADLAIGVKLHCENNRGEDFYSDNRKDGYAYIEGRKILENIKNAIDIKEKDAIAIAHNFIEFAFDLNLNDCNSNLINLYQKSIDNCNFDRISACLSEYINLEKELILEELDKFVKVLSPENLCSAKLIVEKIAVFLAKYRYNKDIKIDDGIKILKKSKEITKDLFLDYLNSVIEKIKIDFADII